MAPSQSITSRYFSKVFNSAASGCLTLMAMPLISRSLGPSGLGQFDYASDSMRLLIDFLSFGVPMAVFNWQARESRERARIGLLGGIALWFGIGACTLGLILLTDVLGLSQRLWPQTAFNILLFAWMFQLATNGQLFISQWADARGLTLISEKRKTLLSAARLTGVAGLYWMASLNLTNYLILQIVTALGFIFITGTTLWRVEVTDSPLIIDKGILGEFFDFIWRYSAPLVFGSFFGYFADYATTWILQYYGGPEQRGYLGLATRVGQIIFLFAGSLTAIFMREMAISIDSKDLPRIQLLFNQTRLLIFVTALISIFAAMNSEHLIQLFGGSQFQGGALVLTIMCLYPIHQVIGQLTTTYFLSSRETKLLTIIGIISTAFTLPLSYLVLAGKSAQIPGLDLGASGRAFLMVGIQFFTTNTLLYIVCKRVNMKFTNWFTYQLKIICSLSFAALLAQAGSSVLVKIFSESAISVSFILITSSLVIYSAIVFVLTTIFPTLLGPFSLTELKNRLLTIIVRARA
jgi:O-antigen/teichoic acid export membrane protein